MRRPLATSISIAAVVLASALGVGVVLAGAPPEAVAGGAAEASRAGGTAGGTAGADGAAAVFAAAQVERDPLGDVPNEADLEFATMMIPHHAQAVELSRILAATRGIDQTSAALAAFIERDQGAEIVRMQGWLDAWHETGAVGHEHGGFMSGMATAEQIAEFDALDGVAAERRFLELMIVHHEGALAMTRDAIAAGRNSWIRALAKHIASEQQREIEAMVARLEQL
ncbi:DUF305 domain-containing protein [Agromyces sp. LHK192]|uniref:DUF305 domain-containing protein n=1 Tax=Agromyces sp. LHK192 TaxID=2498704 RepID=UPI000FDBC25B|nr:DUF305 domain-containing protein [Agromyces sp. LHK192]